MRCQVGMVLSERNGAARRCRGNAGLFGQLVAFPVPLGVGCCIWRYDTRWLPQSILRPWLRLRCLAALAVGLGLRLLPTGKPLATFQLAFVQATGMAVWPLGGWLMVLRGLVLGVAVAGAALAVVYEFWTGRELGSVL